MPMTFPAHAAAILPFVGRATRWLPGTALLVGSAAPDFAFIIGAEAGRWSHTARALFLFCIPVGLAVYAALDGVILPVVRGASGILARALPGRDLVRSLRGWLSVVAALLVGSLTHLAWDAVTHADRWPGDVLFSEAEAAVSHLVSSYVGSVIVVLWALVRFLRGEPQRGWQPRALAILFVGVVAGTCTAVWLRFGSFEVATHLPVAWTVMGGAFVGLLIAAGAIDSKRRRRTTHAS